MSEKNHSQSRKQDLPRAEKMSALLESAGVSLSPAALNKLWTYHQLLREHNTELNLTRIHNFTGMVLKLYADSILPGQLMDLPSPLLDLGTGPGMPGIPLKIAYPELGVILAESRQKRVDFLRMAREALQLDGIEIVGKKITADFQESVTGVITRALESIAITLDRIAGCLVKDGFVIFMKGPHCDHEIQEAGKRFSREYRLLRDHPYRIPGTPHQRRLVVFQRTGEPLGERKSKAMRRHPLRRIESESNELFKDLKKLLGSHGIKKQQKALVAGPKQTTEILKQTPDLCEAWITRTEGAPPPPEAPEHLAWLQMEPSLFQQIDIFGTHSPLLLVRLPGVPEWDPRDGLPRGCTVFVPFQDPENVGAVIRSAVAFGAAQVVLLAESAHPYHPKSLRASGGAVLYAKLLEGPSLQDLPEDLPILGLSQRGAEISEAVFPESFGLLVGMEGPGLPARWHKNALAIPIHPQVESLNAATAAAVALYVWSRSVKVKSKSEVSKDALLRGPDQLE